MIELTTEQKEAKIRVLVQQVSELQSLVLDYQIRDAASTVDEKEEW